MATTRVSTQSYGSKLGDSFKGIIGGFFAIIIAIVLLWWNEGRAVQTAKSLEEGRGAVVSVAIDEVSSDNEGNLVHLSGMATTEDFLGDSQYGFGDTAIKIEKIVEMYQYKENKKEEKKDNVGGSTTTTTTYTYEEVWSEELINSSNFEESWRDNPTSFDHKSEEWKASTVNVGAYELSDALINQMGGYVEYPISEEMIADSVYDFSLTNGMIYYGYDHKYPEIGDERIKYEIVYPQDVSVMAQQIGNSFQAYQTEAGDPLNMISTGIKSSEEMIAAAEAANSMMTWVLRFIGFFIMFAGFSAILKPLSVAGSVLPFLGNILGAGAGLIAGVLAFAISFIIIAIAWIFYRPILGIILLAVAVGSIFAAKKFFGKDAEPPAVKES
ncbi:MAG: TMEM43 family protein [Chitinophagales bacterium]